MKKEYTPKDSGKLCTKLKTFLFNQTEFKTMLEICRGINEPDSRVGTISSRYRDLVFIGFVPDYNSKEVNGRKLQTYKLSKPLFTNGCLFNETTEGAEL